MAKVYVIIGSAGQWDSYSEWLVSAHLSAAGANFRIGNLVEERARVDAKNGVRRAPSEPIECALDPDGEEGATYRLKELELEP